MHVTVDNVNFCDGLECVYVKNKTVHQQHVNCLINTWVLSLKTWMLIACGAAFCAIIEFISGFILFSQALIYCFSIVRNKLIFCFGKVKKNMDKYIMAIYLSQSKYKILLFPHPCFV